MRSASLALSRQNLFPSTGYKSTVFMRHVIRECDHWIGWETSPAHARYFCYKEDRHGKQALLTWADVLETLYEGIREEGLSMNLGVTYEYLAHAVVCLAYWDGVISASGRTEWPVQHFIHIISLGLDVPPPPAALDAQPKPEDAGEGSGEPQPEAMQFGEGSGEPQPEAMQFGEGSGEPQPEAMQFGEGILEPQPEAMQFGEGSGEPQPEAMQFGEGSGEPQPEAMQFGEGSGEPQPEAMEIGEGILEPHSEAEEPATMTSVERSGARRRLAGVPMDTDAVRGIKRYRLRETYERELSRYKNARRRYSLRNTEARQERLADMEQDLKRERNAGSERSRKRSRL